MRILIVEDEPKVASFIRRALEEESYAVDVCADGIQGRDLASEVNYDLIILDLLLPGLAGIDVLKAIRDAKGQHADSHFDRSLKSGTTRERAGCRRGRLSHQTLCH